jgi:hypothetical protein
MSANFPAWLDRLAAVSLAVAALCAVAIVIDEVLHPQKMWVMNLVWPLTALFGSFLWLAAYWVWGRAPPRRGATARRPTRAVAVFKASSHCGAGCTVGDLAAEWLAFGVPGTAVLFGWHSLFIDKTFAVWVLDFILAFILGIGFQYFTIKPMRNLSVGEGLVAALKADAVSITSWQVGMYGLMAMVQYGWYRREFGGIASVASPEFWWAMQLAMLAGFAASYPVNWLLIHHGWKEEM